MIFFGGGSTCCWLSIFCLFSSIHLPQHVAAGGFDLFETRREEELSAEILTQYDGFSEHAETLTNSPEDPLRLFETSTDTLDDETWGTAQAERPQWYPEPRALKPDSPSTDIFVVHAEHRPFNFSLTSRHGLSFILVGLLLFAALWLTRAHTPGQPGPSFLEGFALSLVFAGAVRMGIQTIADAYGPQPIGASMFLKALLVFAVIFLPLQTILMISILCFFVLILAYILMHFALFMYLLFMGIKSMFSILGVLIDRVNV